MSELSNAIMNRVKTLLKEKDISQAEFARKIGVSPQTLSAWLMNRNTPGIDAIAKMCEVLKVSPSWLFTGKMDDPNHQTIIKEDSICIPLFEEVTASCGNGTRIETATEVRLIEVNLQWISRFCGSANKKALNIISINGDSMEPTFKDGDFVIVDISAKRAYTDAVFAYMLDDDLFVKRVQRSGRSLVIMSDNPRYKTITLTSEDMEYGFKIIGRVVTICNIKAI